MGKRSKQIFCWKLIPDSSCMWKETVDMDILITSRNGDGIAYST